MNLEYQGNVEIRINNKKYRIRNKGSDHLFRLLTTFLAGGDYDRINLPATLGLFNCSPTELFSLTESDLASVQLNREPIDISSKETYDSPNFCAVFNSVIESSHINSNKMVNTAKSFSLALMNGYDINGQTTKPDIILAAVEFDPSYWENLLSGSSAVIQWTLTITNSTGGK